MFASTTFSSFMLQLPRHTFGLQVYSFDLSESYLTISPCSHLLLSITNKKSCLAVCSNENEELSTSAVNTV